MQDERKKNRSSLHSIWDFIVKTSGSFSFGVSMIAIKMEQIFFLSNNPKDMFSKRLY